MILTAFSIFLYDVTQKSKSFKPIIAYPNRIIAQLYQQMNRQLAILGKVKAALPTELAVHALHCVVSGHKLLVYTDSAVWASQLRFYGTTLLAAFESDPSVLVSEIHFKINNVATTSKANPISKTIIPPATVAIEIRNLSLAATDPQLEQALAKLSATLTRLQPEK
jgi:hypothetical protein